MTANLAIEMVRYRHFNHDFTDSVIYAALFIKPEFAKPKVIMLTDGKKMETRYFKFYRNAITGRLPDNVSYNVYWKQINEELGQEIEESRDGGGCRDGDQPGRDDIGGDLPAHRRRAAWRSRRHPTRPERVCRRAN